MCRLHQHLKNYIKALKKDANTTVFESILADFQRERERERERDRDRDRERQRQRQRETERQTDRQTETDRQTDRQKEKTRTLFMKMKERIFFIKMECLYLTNHWNYQWLLSSSSTNN